MSLFTITLVVLTERLELGGHLRVRWSLANRDSRQRYLGPGEEERPGVGGSVWE